MSAQVTPPEAGASPPTVVSLGSSLIAGRSPIGGEQLPGVAEALQCVGPAVLQVDAGAGDQVPDGSRDQHLAGPGGGHDPGAEVDGDPADVVVAQLELPGVDPGPDLDAGLAQLPAQPEGAADAPAGPVEDGQDPVAGPLDQPSPLLGDQQ